MGVLGVFMLLESANVQFVKQQKLLPFFADSRRTAYPIEKKLYSQDRGDETFPTSPLSTRSVRIFCALIWRKSKFKADWRRWGGSRKTTRFAPRLLFPMAARWQIEWQWNEQRRVLIWDKSIFEDDEETWDPSWRCYRTLDAAIE
jgi:hypothetical protein